MSLDVSQCMLNYLTLTVGTVASASAALRCAPLRCTALAHSVQLGRAERNVPLAAATDHAPTDNLPMTLN